MANGPFKMKGMSFKNDQAPIKKINLGTFLDPAGIFTGKSAPWHPGIFEGILGRRSREMYGPWSEGQRYSSNPRGWDSTGGTSSYGSRVSRGRNRGRTVTANRSGSGKSGGKKVIVKKNS